MRECSHLRAALPPETQSPLFPHICTCTHTKMWFAHTQWQQDSPGSPSADPSAGCVLSLAAKQQASDVSLAQCVKT